RLEPNRPASPDARGVGLFREKKFAKLPIGFFRRLFREIVPARQRLGAADIGGVPVPHLLRLVVPSNAAGGAPQQQHWNSNLPAGVEVLGVHLEVDAEGGAVVLADG